MSKIKISIIGATGYTGIELLKILLQHPQVEIKYLTAGSSEGKISDHYPHFKNICDITLSKISPEKIAKESDTIFLALPHGESEKIIPEIIGKCKIIDLGNDYRLKKSFTYGVPEIYKKEIAKSQNVANPGCFAIAGQLALYPLKGQIKKAYIQAITGSSGSGKSPSEITHHPIRNHNLKSYKITTHQHIPEILYSSGLKEKDLIFVPSSGPFTRGIHLTAFIEFKKTLNNAKKLYEKVYANCPFIRISENVELANVIGSNFCDIAIHQTSQGLVVQTVIDNLIKGAAGTAIQNFNLMHGFKENMALNQLIPLYP